MGIREVCSLDDSDEEGPIVGDKVYGGGRSREALSSTCPLRSPSSSPSSSSSPIVKVSSSLTAPSILFDVSVSAHHFPFELTTLTPPKHARQGLYLASRGFDDRQVGQMGRVQHAVMKMSLLERGREDEHAKQRVVEWSIT